MVGYRESQYSYNDPDDGWEQKIKSLLGKILSGPKPMPKSNPEHPDFWQTVPEYKNPYDTTEPMPKYTEESARRKMLEFSRGKGSKGFKPYIRRPGK